jgi:hypothetical protein
MGCIAQGKRLKPLQGAIYTKDLGLKPRAML